MRARNSCSLTRGALATRCAALGTANAGDAVAAVAAVAVAAVAAAVAAAAVAAAATPATVAAADDVDVALTFWPSLSSLRKR
jgi:hypothetical protein